ncbi:hypothetical protein HAX54_025864 [Datura stramonium]|uniref:Leucine-rich repeat-containing N-terminal plant-type domain-containing protein n=1 Tax=Datura stramonium TaxID=4076 RepID=A0ABS8V0A3_DATST|nr:hypothetical protein [Datura stramonium]
MARERKDYKFMPEVHTVDVWLGIPVSTDFLFFFFSIPLSAKECKGEQRRERRIAVAWWLRELQGEALVEVNKKSAAFLGNETDKLALLGFKSQITEDPSRVFASWNHSVHFCKWTGVKCGLRRERVIRLNLKGLRLAGTVSGHLGNLSFANYLDLAENSFHDEIPPKSQQAVKASIPEFEF